MENFSCSFDGTTVDIRDIKFTIMESMITKSTEFPRSGEKWFKNMGINGEYWNVFLKNPNMDTTVFKKGIPSTMLKSKWRNLLLVLKEIFY